VDGNLPDSDLRKASPPDPFRILHLASRARRI